MQPNDLNASEEDYKPIKLEGKGISVENFYKVEGNFLHLLKELKQLTLQKTKAMM